MAVRSVAVRSLAGGLTAPSNFNVLLLKSLEKNMGRESYRKSSFKSVSSDYLGVIPGVSKEAYKVNQA